MEPTTQSSSSNQKAGDVAQTPIVEVTRTFHAPADRVWNAWAKPELVQQWWGPEGFSCPEAKADFRVGGKYLFAMKDPEGRVAWSGGTYEELIPKVKLVYTDNFTDNEGTPVPPKVYGMPGEWGKTSRVTVEFEELGPKETKMRLRHAGIPAEMHDDCVDGWSSTIDRLQKVVEPS